MESFPYLAKRFVHLGIATLEVLNESIALLYFNGTNEGIVKNMDEVLVENIWRN